MSAEAWSALISAIGVVTAIGLQIVEWRRARFSRGIDLIATLDARFDGPELRGSRRAAAAFLQNPIETNTAGRAAAIEVINFFECVGFLHRKKAVDTEAVWHFFASWLLPYFAATKNLRSAVIAGDPSVYCEFERVYQAVKRTEEKRHSSRDTLHIVGADALSAFLAREAALLPKHPPFGDLNADSMPSVA